MRRLSRQNAGRFTRHQTQDRSLGVESIGQTVDAISRQTSGVLSRRSSADKIFIKKFLIIFIPCCILLCFIYRLNYHRGKANDLHKYLQNDGLGDHFSALKQAGVHSKCDFANLNRQYSDKLHLSLNAKEAILKSAKRLYNELTLNQALKEYGILEYKQQLQINYNVYSLDELVKQKVLIELNPIDSGMIEQFRARRKLNQLIEYISSGTNEESLWTSTVRDNNELVYGNVILMSFVIATIIVLFQTSTVKDTTSSIANTRNLFKLNNWIHYDGEVEWGWQEPVQVGSAMSFILKFFVHPIKRAYPVTDKDNLKIEITCDTTGQIIAHNAEYGVGDANTVKVSFTIRRRGDYSIAVILDGRDITGSPFKRVFQSGPIDPSKTRLVIESSMFLCTEKQENSLYIEPKDCFGNICGVNVLEDTSNTYSIHVSKCGSRDPVDIFQWFTYDLYKKCICGKIRLQHAGCYKASFLCNGTQVINGDFNILVLNEPDMGLVKKTISRKKYDKWYECRLLQCQGRRLDKPKKVYCYISPKQLTFKEYYMKIIPKRLLTFRVCPSTKFTIGGTNNQFDSPIFNIDDGCQATVELASKDRSIIVATFTNYLLKNIGGSETFKDKQDFFNSEIRKLHEKHSHSRLAITVHRDNLLESSMKAVKSFSLSDWCKNLEITFKGEEGLDWGGLRREWFELVCTQLFDPTKSGLFRTYRENNQGLVHPTPNISRSSDLKSKHYEFAGRIVAKCLYESALGGSYRQSVKAQFSRSFLAQLIGLRVNYKYFEQDDPELYISKIRYIEENDVEDMEIYFVEEEYDQQGKVIQEVELIQNGRNIQVAKDNKLQYLDALAVYRLTTKIQPEVESFLKGLNDLVPDNLLSIFDENELELLMCGTGNYSVADLKANHSLSSYMLGSSKLLEWFWTIVGNFTQEELAKLLQFTTGSSQLPPGGFKELSPAFQITLVGSRGCLPTAHTCFNQLCIPQYDSIDEFHHALVLAINEGSQGFGMV